MEIRTQKNRCAPMYYGSLDEMLIWKESIISINQFTKESNMNSISQMLNIPKHNVYMIATYRRWANA